MKTFTVNFNFYLQKLFILTIFCSIKLIRGYFFSFLIYMTYILGHKKFNIKFSLSIQVFIDIFHKTLYWLGISVCQSVKYIQTKILEVMNLIKKYFFQIVWKYYLAIINSKRKIPSKFLMQLVLKILHFKFHFNRF